MTSDDKEPPYDFSPDEINDPKRCIDCGCEMKWDDYEYEWKCHICKPPDDELDESMDGDFDSGMRSAGFGTDEDYGGTIE